MVLSLKKSLHPVDQGIAKIRFLDYLATMSTRKKSSLFLLIVA